MHRQATASRPPRNDPGKAPSIPVRTTVSLAWLEVDPEGRILALDPAAGRFLEDGGTAICTARAGRLSIRPERPFREALQLACREEDPQPWVCKPESGEGGELLQVNILPFDRDRVRIVLFLEQAELAMGAEERPHLTPREMSVLRLAATGLRRDRIAHRLNISLPTVDMHFRNLRQKLSALTISEAVATAMRMRLLEL